MLLSFVAHPQMQKCLQTLQKWCNLAQRADSAQCPLAAGIWSTLAGMMGLSVLTAYGKQPLNSGAFTSVYARGHERSNEACIWGYIKWPFLPHSCPCVYSFCFCFFNFVFCFLSYVVIFIFFIFHNRSVDHGGLVCDKSSSHLHAASLRPPRVSVKEERWCTVCDFDATQKRFNNKALCQCSPRNVLKNEQFAILCRESPHWVNTKTSALIHKGGHEHYFYMRKESRPRWESENRNGSGMPRTAAWNAGQAYDKAA